MGRNRKKPLHTEVKIVDVGAEGKAVGKVDDVVVFTTYAVPGDIVDIQVTKKRKRFQEGRVVKFHEYSKDRAEPFCEYFGVCGGCKWQNLPYDKQLQYKQKQVVDQLTRIGGIELPEIASIVASEKTEFYRNKLEYTFSNKRWLTYEQIDSKEEFANMAGCGFHIPGMFDKIVDIEKCWLQPSPSNEVRNFVREYAFENDLTFFDIKGHTGFLRTMIIRTSSTGEVMVILSLYHEDVEAREALLTAVAEKFPEITSLMYVINEKPNDTISDQDIICFKGADHIFEEMEGIKFKIGPKSFYQTNSEQAYNLYKITREFAGLTGEEVVYDLYTGTGTIANFVAKNCSSVVGIEYVPDAIEDAKINSSLNGIENTLFFAGDMKKVLTDQFVAEHGKPDVIITDPPRAGMDTAVVDVILNTAAAKIVYVSCNPATQARDLALMDHMYKVTKVAPVDMFPHTHHVENIVLLELR